MSYMTKKIGSYERYVALYVDDTKEALYPVNSDAEVNEGNRGGYYNRKKPSLVEV